MKNNFKRIAAVVLAVIMCVSAVLPVLAAEETCPGANKTHTLENTPNYELVSEKPADCENDGLNTYKCKDCGASFVEVLDKIGAHDYEVLAEIAPDCDTDGLKTSVCKVCGDEKREEVKALGHTYTYTFKEAGKTLCDKGAEYFAVCSVCDHKLGSKDAYLKANGHEWELVEITVAPTCMTTGKATYACVNCDEKFTDVVVEKNNHAGTAVAQKIVKKADCATDARVLYKCDACAQTFEATPAVGTVVEIKDAKGNVVTSYTVVAKGCHNVKNYTEYGEAKAATCLVNGYNADDVICNGCGTPYYKNGNSYVEFSGLAKTDARVAKHTWESGTTDGWVWIGAAGDCTHNGTQTRYCTVCKTSEKKEHVAPGHKEPAATVTASWDKVTADCVTAGHVKYKCTECSEWITKSTTAKLGHSFTVEGAKKYIGDHNGTLIVNGAPVYCGEAYAVEMKCSRTGCTESTWDLVKKSMPEHKYETKVIKTPNCKEKGYSLKVCVLCATTAANGVVTYHDYDEKEFITAGEYAGLDDNKKAEYAQIGDKYAKKYDITETVADKHVWDAATAANTTKAPTCTATGLQYATCTLCNTTAQIELAALGHAWDAGVQLPGTGNCTVAKVMKFTCTRGCGATKEEGVANDTNGKGHSADKKAENGYVAAKAATCTTNGTTEGYFCANPDCEFSWKNNKDLVTKKYLQTPEEILNFHGEKEDPVTGEITIDTSVMVKTEKVDPTCFTDGNYEYYTCKLGSACTAKTGTGTAAYQHQVYYVGNELKPANKAADLVITKVPHSANAGKGIREEKTCVEYAYETKVCALCDTAYTMKYEGVGEDLTHNYDTNGNLTTNIEDAVIVDNCAQGLKVVMTCVDCGYVATDKETAAILGCDEKDIKREAGHYNADGEAISTDCYSQVENRKCVYCNEIIEAADHTYGAVKFEANLEVMTCTTCGYKLEVAHTHDFTDFVADGEFNHKATCACGKESVSGHTWDAGKVTTAAAVGTAGVKTFTCTACLTTRTEEIPALVAPVVDNNNQTQTPADDDKGCGASVAAMGIALVAALGTCAVFTAKKKED